MTESKTQFDEKIRNRMLLWILSSAAAVLLVLGFALYALARRAVEEEAGSKVIGHLGWAAESVNAWLESRMRLTEGLGLLLERQPDSTPTALAASLHAFGERFGSKDPFVGLETGVYIDPAWTPGPGYDHRVRTWYKETKAAASPTFSEPYLDGDTGRMVVTLGVPLRKVQRFVGVAAVDVFPEQVLKQLRLSGKRHSFEGFVVDRRGRYIAHPREDYILRKQIQDSPDGPTYESWLRSGRAGLVPAAGYYLAFRPIQSAGWTAVFRIERSAVEAPAKRMTTFFAAGAVAALGVLALVIVLICQVLTRPILRLADGAGRIAEGNYDYRVPITTRDELGYLSDSFNNMAVGLTEREKIRSELARIDGELQAAHGIQLAMLPRTVPVGERFLLHAFYQSAKEVGGDFYDYFPLPDGRYAIVVGDVSGKGVPAALFMAITCSMLRACCPDRPDPGAAMTACNDMLAAHNEETMFVTLFLAYYDPETGACTYANGGHTEPLVLGADGGVKTVPTLGDFMVGPIGGVAFATGFFTLEPGDLCLAYTDGVTEAHAPDQSLFGDERLLDLLREHGSRDLNTLCETIRHDVMAFQEGAQFDDITLLCWRRES